VTWVVQTGRSKCCLIKRCGRDAGDLSGERGLGCGDEAVVGSLPRSRIDGPKRDFSNIVAACLDAWQNLTISIVMLRHPVSHCFKSLDSFNAQRDANHASRLPQHFRMSDGYELADGSQFFICRRFDENFWTDPGRIAHRQGNDWQGRIR
jgi:hypothetical protein